MKTTNPYGKNNETLTVETTEQNNSSTKEINNICPSSDERDIFLEELSNNFDKIWQEYPRKEGKNSAFKYYKKWLKGKMYAGKRIKLTNKQMWYATKKYAEITEENKTERQFIKMGSTFFNEAIMEYVEEIQE